MTQQNHAEEQARAQLDSIRDMVAALECDYDRLDELKEARDELREEFDDNPENAGVDFDNWARNQHAIASEDCDELAKLTKAAGECSSQDEARERIQEDALSVEVRSDWHALGETSDPSEFCILLCTGGPAVRIVGELDQGEPSRGRIEYQDWGTPWTELVSITREERAAIDAYCSCFYFGE